jgi:hypothetical protein
MPKSWTGVEKKDNGTLVYRERGALFIWFKKNRYSCVINNSTYSILKITALLEGFIGFFGLIYLRHSYSPQTITFIFLVSIVALIVDTMIGFFITRILQKRDISYEKK